MHDAEELMRIAIAQARAGIAGGQSPFGCAVGRAGHVVAAAHNGVFATTDITAHAEVAALRAACAATGDVLLEGCVVATTCEPCPMCAAALHWARVETVYYGATIADAQTAGFNELALPAASLLEMGGSSVKLVPGVLQEECRALFEEWKDTAGHRAY